MKMKNILFSKDKDWDVSLYLASSLGFGALLLVKLAEGGLSWLETLAAPIFLILLNLIVNIVDRSKQ